MRIWLRLGAALLLTVSIGGCTGDKTADDPDRADTVRVASPPVVTATPAVDQIAGLSLPVEAYMLTAAQRKLSYGAVTKVTNECLQSFGFTDFVQSPSAQAPSLLTHRYGVTDPAKAARYGYHSAPDEGGLSSAAKPAAGRNFSAAQNLVLYGSPEGEATGAPAHNGQTIPAGGCYGEARRKTKGDLIDQADPEGVVAQIASNSSKQSETDPRVVAVFAKWSSCMKAKGFDYPMPIGLADNDKEMERSFNAATPSEREIRTAVADVACKKQHNVVGTWLAVETAYQNTMIQQKQERLTAVRTAIADAMRACATIGG